MEAIWNLEIIILAALQTIFSGSMEIMRAITSLGSEKFFILWLPVILWCIDYGLGIKIGMILISSGQIFSTLKMVFHSPRPFWFSSAIRPFSVETGFGMPSGHATNTMSIFGLAAAEVKQRWLTILCVLVIFLVGLSRMVLGMHFISDVLAGWLLGGLLIWGFTKLSTPFLGWFLHQKSLVQYLIAIGSTGIWLLICLLPALQAATVPVPEEWVKNALAHGLALRPDPYHIAGFFSNSGIWAGLILGAIWLHQRGGMHVKGNIHQNILKIIIGVVGLLVLWMGLDKVFPDGISALALFLRFLRYLVVGLWVSGFAPELFIRLKLASRKVDRDNTRFAPTL